MGRPVPRFADHQEHFRLLRGAALEAVDPAEAVRRVLRVRRGVVHVGRRRISLRRGGVFLIAMGKAALPMCRAAVEVVGGHFTEGVAAAPGPRLEAFPANIRAYSGGHPLPDRESLAAGRHVADLLAKTTKDDLVLVLVSGGGSAMLEHSAPGVSLDDLRRLNDLLLRSGLPIQAINTIRCSLSQLKAGGLVRMAGEARVVGLVLSDVPGDDLAAVASGPTVPMRDPRLRAIGILQGAGLWGQVPESVRTSLSGARMPWARSPSAATTLVASNRHALDAAERQARALGFTPDRVARPVRGEAREAGGALARRLLRSKLSTGLVAGGETTVAVENGGLGGRNQELALQAAQVMDGRQAVALMAFATDGIDGPTDAAGAVVTGSTAGEVRALGLDLEGALARHDSYPVLAAAQALIRTGPTGTNVADVIVGLAYAA
jgi:glycerate 2-kinase